MSVQTQKTQIHSDMWCHNYVITISGEGAFSADYNECIREIKFVGTKCGTSLRKSQLSPYSCSLAEKQQSVKLSKASN